MTLLRVNDLKIGLKKERKTLVDGISFNLYKNEVLAIVGESGSGKSLTSQAILGLLNRKIFNLEGQVIYKGLNLLDIREKEMCKIRGNEISMVYQNPFTALNPLFKISYQLGEALKIHENINKKHRKERIKEILQLVQIKNIEETLNKYPYELSGGQLQRVVIGMALITKPTILIADEPTTALDVTTQKEIINLLNKLSNELDMSILLVSHDLGIVAELADRVAVMKDGELIENQNVLDFFSRPKKQYSKRLLDARL